MHLMAATKMHGVPYADVLALIRFVAPYSGYPAAADALGALPEIARNLGVGNRSRS
jgi:alkylhydroperoxidase/carboxymuconolactone decarboxylase family protein YurZ